ncbi:lysophospholipid acyltransferase family protein [Terrabacter aerolatus]|uniref:1-acyl-sn-glycerol-3-phosphate acyltransferase n=1 Tax=Terrabacter aerolatus TaxID=422442 RepID=A0A512D4F8_9MICO|nr:lysophospholipid acyltransferase family protein [Terrabacter aerolatus]GEO31347.1 1-acyl-sn-glycerol-3-phosphate acyltransferase [Terrabacter aerolatus]
MTDRTYRLVIRAALGLFAGLGLRIDVRGAEHLPSRGGAVLASNHVGFLDFLFVGLVGRQRGRFVRFLAKDGVFTPPVVGQAMRAMGHVPVDRAHGEVALRHAVAHAGAGEVVGLFPEATISHSWELRPFRPGAAAVATWCAVPLVPVAVWGSQRLLTVGGRFSLRRGTAVTIVVGEPLHPDADDDPYAVTEQLRARVDALLAEAVETHPDRPRDDADRWWMPASRGGTAPGPEEGLRLDELGMRKADQAAEARNRRSRKRARSRRSPLAGPSAQ